MKPLDTFLVAAGFAVAELLLILFLFTVAGINVSTGAKNLMEEETGMAAIQTVWNSYSFKFFPSGCGTSYYTKGPVPMGNSSGAVDVIVLSLKHKTVCSLWGKEWRD
ncbi:MAG: hypothetical protein QXP84_05290 [Candidatus Korarchaeum sp.]